MSSVATRAIEHPLSGLQVEQPDDTCDLGSCTLLKGLRICQVSLLRIIAFHVPAAKKASILLPPFLLCYPLYWCAYHGAPPSKKDNKKIFTSIREGWRAVGPPRTASFSRSGSAAALPERETCWLRGRVPRPRAPTRPCCALT